jgi:hypothetical protein
MRIAAGYERKVLNALTGNYDPILQANSPLKLRMHVQKLSTAFASDMARSGHSRIFRTLEDSVDKDFSYPECSQENIYD